MVSKTDIADLADAIAAAAVNDLDEHGRRIAVSLYELLADGEPVTLASLAERASVDEQAAADTVGGWPGVFRDDDGRVVGFWGLAIPEMGHRFQAEGGKPIHAWCALDPFLIVPVIGRPAAVESKDPVTGEAVTMTVTPDGIRDLAPASAVTSLLRPDGPFEGDVIETFCHHVLNFASRESLGGPPGATTSSCSRCRTHSRSACAPGQGCARPAPASRPSTAATGRHGCSAPRSGPIDVPVSQLRRVRPSEGSRRHVAVQQQHHRSP